MESWGISLYSLCSDSSQPRCACISCKICELGFMDVRADCGRKCWYWTVFATRQNFVWLPELVNYYERTVIRSGLVDFRGISLWCQNALFWVTLYDWTLWLFSQTADEMCAIYACTSAIVVLPTFPSWQHILQCFSSFCFPHFQWWAHLTEKLVLITKNQLTKKLLNHSHCQINYVSRCTSSVWKR